MLRKLLKNSSVKKPEKNKKYLNKRVNEFYEVYNYGSKKENGKKSSYKKESGT